MSMLYLWNNKGGPLGKVVNYDWKKEYQKCSAVHWHMLRVEQMPYWLPLAVSMVLLLPNTKQNLQSYADSFTPSQGADLQWLTGNLVWRQALSCNDRGQQGQEKHML